MHATIFKRQKSRFILSICLACLLIEKFFSFFLLWEKAKWTLQRYFSLIIYQFCNKLKAQRKKKLYCIKLFLEDTQQKNKENVPPPAPKNLKCFCFFILSFSCCFSRRCRRGLGKFKLFGGDCHWPNANLCATEQVGKTLLLVSISLHFTFLLVQLSFV